MADILMVEDNSKLAELIKSFLERDGYTVEVLSDGETALALLRREQTKLVLLDIMLPGMDGFAICQAIRRESNIPVLILSARSAKEDKMSGFSLGADDYLEKPVDVDILRAKINVLMHRNYELKQNARMLHSGGLTIDRDTMQVFLGGREIPLTGKEYELLLLFAENPGKTLNKEYLFNKVWGADSFSENQTLTVHVKTLRDKIEEDPKNPQRIRTVWGVGYKYEMKQ